MTMLARDLMTKPVVTVSPDTPVNEVARILLDHGIAAAPVSNETDHPMDLFALNHVIAAAIAAWA